MTTIIYGMTGREVRNAVNGNIAELQTTYLAAIYIANVNSNQSVANFMSAMNAQLAEFSILIALTTTDYTPYTPATADIATVINDNFTVMTARSVTFQGDGRHYYLHIKQSTIPSKGTANILAQQGSYKLAYYASEDILYLSEDCGLTYPYSIATPYQIELISLAHVFSNGNILISFAKTNKLYHSLDKLSTLTEFFCQDAVYGGNLTFHVPVNALYPGDYFGALNTESYFIGTKEILIFGNYPHHNTINSAGADDRGAAPIKIYATSDKGATLKCIYHFGQNNSGDTTMLDDGTPDGGAGGNLLGDPLNNLITKHYHFIAFDHVRNEFVLQFGDDGAVAPNSCVHWMKVTYNVVTDAYTVTDNQFDSSFFRGVGMRFFPAADFIYWASDGNGNIYKIDQPNMFDTDLGHHTLIYNAVNNLLGLSAYGKLMMAAAYNTVIEIYVSNDYGVTWDATPFAYRQALLAVVNFGVFKLIKADDNGYLLVHRTNQVIPLNPQSSFLVKMMDKP
jgi:hypothetical protein